MMHVYHSLMAIVVNNLSLAKRRARAHRSGLRLFAKVSAGIKPALRRTLCIALAICLLTTSTPAAAETIVGVYGESSVSFGFWLRANKLPERLVRTLTGRGPQLQTQEKQQDRDMLVSQLRISPEDVTLNVGQRVSFAAVAYDRQGDAVGGIKTKWKAVGDDGQPVPVSGRGEFEPGRAGVYRISAEGAGQSAQTKVTVVAVPGQRQLRGPMTGGRAVSTRDLPAERKSSKGRQPAAVGASGALAAKLAGKRGTRKEQLQRAHAQPPLPVPLDDGDGWNDGNYTSADDPGNLPGNPPGSPLDGGAGNGNFQIASPVGGWPGRGIDVSLGLSYNSRLWNKAGNQITYDIDRGWPAPGWSLGFGKLLQMGSQGSMLIDADGTRHPYTGVIYNWGYATYFVGHTTDGSLIDYTSLTYTWNGAFGGEARYPNGTSIWYGTSGTSAAYPTSIIDANGNYLNVTYPNNVGPRIQTIMDTLGRTINFSYDSNNLLTAITAPGLGGGTRTLVRLHYRQLSLGYSFSGLTPVVRDPYPWVIDAIYYPGTATGYWFGDSDSYSTYGMIAKVSERRNMTYSPPSLTDQGTISVSEAGQISREEVYNYPLTTGSPGGSGLTNAPTYTTATETWTRDGVNVDSATTTYEVHENSTPRTVTITLPNGTTSKQFSYNSPGSYLDGLVYLDETRDAAGALLQQSTSSWALGAYDSPRPTQVQATTVRNGTNQTISTQFSYGGVYNQVSDVRNYDYQGGLLRSTRTQYQNSTDYTNRHIFNLPLIVEVFGSDYWTRVSRTDYQYDGQTLEPVSELDLVMHDPSYDPNTSGVSYPCCQYQWDPYTDSYVCVDWESCPVSIYNPSTEFRGNVTQVTKYPDAVSLSGPVTETRRYDITGNLVKAGAACCEQVSWLYTVDTQYAYPQAQTRGSASDPYAQVKTSNTYDFNTGLTLSATDANGRQSQTTYSTDSLRPQSITLPTLAHTDYAYDDAGMSVSETTYLDAHPTHATIADQNVKLLNGRGQVRQEKALGAPGVWDFVDSIYDNMGQVSQQSLPYRTGDTPQFATTTYDALGRVIKVVAPDGSATETYYNEKDTNTSDGYVPVVPDVVNPTTAGETTLVRDAWGRERWGRVDSQQRLVEVVEPNPSGNGSGATGGLLTTYSYDTLGNLTGVGQGSQTRAFKYDALGRLTQQKLAEANATLNDTGVYQAGGGTWSNVFTYDERSNVTSRTDARGVKSVFTYSSDPLNRLQSVSWDTSGFGDSANPILSAATVSYQYRTKSTGSQLLDITQLSSVTTAGISTESYGYDGEGRINSNTLTVTSRSAFPFVTDYIYDELDRLVEALYPKEYGNGSEQRKLAHYDYDVASRPTTLTVGGANHASNVAYNASSQTTTVKVGLSGANQITENYAYSPQTGLLESQTVVRGTTPTLLDLAYDYAGANGKRTGQLTKILNNKNHNRDRGYVYDALSRLQQATGGPAGAVLWTQNYSYDRYGNRTAVSATGNSASLEKPAGNPIREATAQNANVKDTERADGNATIRESSVAASTSLPEPEEPRVVLPTDQLAARSNVELPRSSRSASRSHHAPRSAPAAPVVPQGGPPVFTDDPLVAGTTTIKAVHLNELRTAVNQARSRASLPAANWAETISVGVAIKAAHIVELRARLDEARAALGLSTATYTDPSLTAGITVKAAHVQELRQKVTEAITATFPIPLDGHASLSYDLMNRITTAGFDYDKAGNQVRALAPGGGGSQRYQYDAANRLVRIKADDNQTVLVSNTYGDTNDRLIAEEAGSRTYYVCEGSAEYVEIGSSTTPQWSKSYFYFGSRLLSTLTPNGSGSELIQYHHPDRLGTRVVTNAQDTTFFEQVSLPFGTPLTAESTGSTNKRFTTYDRSQTSGLDYAINRHYDPRQGRFTQVDPIGMGAVTLENPQTLNLYAYCANDPVNQTDPTGLGFFSFLKKLFKWLVVAFTVAVAIVAIILAPELAVNIFQMVLNIIAAVAGAASSVLNALGLTKAGSILAIIGAAASFGASTIAAVLKTNWKTVLKAISDGVGFASKMLTQLGYKRLGQIFDLVSSVTKFISDGLTVDDKTGKYGWAASKWEVYKFIRGTAEKVANLAGATRLAGYLNTLGFIDDIGDLYLGIKYFNTVLNKKWNIKHPRENLGADVKRFGKVVDSDDATRRLLRLHGRLTTLRALVNNVNSTFMRVDRGIALAR